MDSTPQISDAEWEVMNQIWDRHPITANELIELLAPRTGWHPKTIKTMLNRLVGKGALSFEVEGNRYLYRPRVSREACVTEESQSFLKRVFRGATAPMLVHFVRNAELSQEDLEALKQLLDDSGRSK